MRNIRDHSDSGFKFVNSSTAAPVGRYFGLQVLTEAVIASVTFEPEYDGDSDIVGATLPAGLYRPMRFTELSLTSGTAIAEML